MFFSKGKVVNSTKQEGRVYIFRFTLEDGTLVWKVGMTNSDRATDRMFEVLRSFFNTYRYSPKCELKRDKKVLIPGLVEKHLHRLLEDWSHKFNKPFGGSTEFFHNLDEAVLLDYLDNFEYKDLLKDQVTIKETDYALIKNAINTQVPQPSLELDEIPF